MRENGSTPADDAPGASPPSAGDPGGGAEAPDVRAGEPEGAEEPRVLEDGTLGGYLRIHERPPGFEGSDGHPYTVSVEVEQVGELREPWGGYLVFPRWAIGGVGVVGHVQTPILCRGRTRGDVEERVGELDLAEVKELLEEAIERSREREAEW